MWKSLELWRNERPAVRQLEKRAREGPLASLANGGSKGGKKNPLPTSEQMHPLPCQWLRSLVWTPAAAAARR